MGQAWCMRCAEAAPRWEDPLSVTGEHPVGAGVGLDAHHLGDQPGERVDPGGGLAAAVHLPAVESPAAR